MKLVQACQIFFGGLLLMVAVPILAKIVTFEFGVTLVFLFIVGYVLMIFNIMRDLDKEELKHK